MDLRNDKIVVVHRLRPVLLAEVHIAKGWIYDNYPDVVFADLGPDPVLPDQVDTVLKIELVEE